MGQQIVFNEEKILERFKNWAEFSGAYKITCANLHYRIANPYFTRLNKSYWNMVRDGYAEIIKG